MLLWINGPFGGGKTQTAHEIPAPAAGQRRLRPGARRLRPAPHAAARTARRLPGLDGLAAGRRARSSTSPCRAREGVVIAPMTVTDPGYFAETVGRLRELGHDVRHFTLLAERETVLRRLRERGSGILGVAAGPRRESWAVEQLDALPGAAARSRSSPSICGPTTRPCRRRPTGSPSSPGLHPAAEPRGPAAAPAPPGGPSASGTSASTDRLRPATGHGLGGRRSPQDALQEVAAQPGHHRRRPAGAARTGRGGGW